MTQRNLLISSLLLVFLSFLPLAPSLKDAGFTEDDWILIVRNDYIKSLANIKENLLTDYFYRTPTKEHGKVGYYRPLTKFSFASDYALWGMKAWGFRLTSILLHLLCVLLLFYITFSFTKQLYVSWLVAFIFGLHPVHINSVVIITARSDLWMTLFLLLAIGKVQKLFQSPKNKNLIIASCGLFFLALLGKESAISLFPILFVCWLISLPTLASWKQELKAFLLPFFALFVVFASYLGLRLLILQIAIKKNAGKFEWIASLNSLANSFVFYLQRLVYPFTHEQVPKLESQQLDFLGLSIAFVLLATILILFVVCRRKAKLLSFGLGFVLAALIPLLLSAPFINNPETASNLPVADRFLYLASCGFSLVVGGIIQVLTKSSNKEEHSTHLSKPSFLLLGTSLCIFLSYGLCSAYAGFERRNQEANLALYLKVLAKKKHRTKKEDCRLFNLKGSALQKKLTSNKTNLTPDEKKTLLSSAKRSFQKAMKLCPTMLPPKVNYAQLLIKEKRYKQAITLLESTFKKYQRHKQKKTINLTDSLSRSLGTMFFLQGLANFYLGKKPLALQHLKRAVQWNRRLQDAYFLICHIEQHATRLSRAIKACKKALQLYPKDHRWLTLAVMQMKLQRRKAGVASFRRFLQVYQRKDRRSQWVKKQLQQLCQQYPEDCR